MTVSPERIEEALAAADGNPHLPRSHEALVILAAALREAQADNIKFCKTLTGIATFRQGERIENEADLLRESARIALADSVTRESIRTNDAGLLAEITSLWADYCNGDLDMSALAQEIGEALEAYKRLAVSPPADECDGSKFCKAETHVHGCFAEQR